MRDAAFFRARAVENAGPVWEAGIPALWRSRDVPGEGRVSLRYRSWGRLPAGNRMLRDRGAQFFYGLGGEEVRGRFARSRGVWQSAVRLSLPGSVARERRAERAGSTAAVR